MLNPGMVIFDDFSTYTRKINWKNNIAESVVVVNSHDPQQINYAFESKEDFLLWRKLLWINPKRAGLLS